MKTEFENLLEKGVDAKNRRIYFGHHNQEVDEYGSVDSTSISYAIRAIHWFSTENPKKPIELHFISYGGDAYAMLALMDAIQTSPCQIKFIGSGPIMSAATWIMSVCDHRALTENATILLHDGSDGFFGNFTDFQIKAKESQRLQSALDKMFAENTRMPLLFWKEVLKRDVYITPQEAILLGLCDEIIEPKKRGNLRQIRRNALATKIPKGKLSKLVKNIYERIGMPVHAQDFTITVKEDEIDESLTVEPEPEISGEPSDGTPT